MIRWKVFLSALALTTLIVWFVSFRLEAWLKSAIESGVSALTETKTEIRRLNLSFKESQLKIKGLAVASKKHEFKNLIEIDSIVIDFQSLPLLSRRFVVDEFSVEGVSWSTDRRTSGWLPKKKKQKKDSWFSKQWEEALSALTKEFEELPVSQLLDYRIPTDPAEILVALDLRSEAEFRSSIAKIQESIALWKTRGRQAKDISDYQKVVGQLQGLTANIPRDPKEIANRIQSANQVYSFFKAEAKKAQDLVRDVQQEQKNLVELVDRANQAVIADYERARKSFSLDQFSVDNLSRMLFGSHWVDEVKNVLVYHAFLRSILDLKSDREKDVEVRQRAKGRDIIFFSPKKQPSFVLAQSNFSVTGLERSGDGRLSQTYEAKLRDVNSNPKLYGKPTTVDLVGRFRSAPIGRAHLDLFWDYTQPVAKDRYALAVEKINAANWPVGIPRVFPLKMDKGSADSRSELSFNGDEMKWTNRIDFSQVDWNFREVPQVGFIVPILAETMQKIRDFYLEINLLRNERGQFSYQVRSDMDQKLLAAIRSVIESRIQQLAARLRLEINARVARYRTEAENQIKSYGSEILAPAESFLKATSAHEAQAAAKIKELESRARSVAEEAVKDRVKDAAKDIKKSLPSIRSPF
jgi:uncharacterized protein (TIGR03545 family)